MSPLAGVPILFLSFPGVLPLRGATAGLLYVAPWPGLKNSARKREPAARQTPIYQPKSLTERFFIANQIKMG